MIRDDEQKRDKLKFFENNNEQIHLSLLNDRFLNGHVKTYNDDSIVFVDAKLGDELIFFSDIKNITKRRYI